MKEDSIQKFHEELYLFLLEKHEMDSSFRFRVRQKGEDRLNKGFWFGGNMDYLETSFWSGSDLIHQTPQIRLCFLFAGKTWSIDFVAKDNESRAKYFTKLANQLGGFTQDRYYPNIWSKQLENTNGNWFKPLDKFIDTTKNEIDDYLKKNRLEKVKTIAESESSTLFDDVGDNQNWDIPEDKFQKNIANINLWKAYLAEHQRLEKLNGETQKSDFAISRISISNFQGIKDLLVENLPLDTKWIFLTGENGFGKTSVLRALAKGLVGDEPFVSPLPNGARVFLNVIVNRKPQKVYAKQNMLADIKIPVAAYGVSRFQLLALNQEESEISGKTTHSLFHDNGQLMNIERLLLDSERDNKPLFNKLKEIIKTVVPYLADIRSKKENNTRKIIYYEKDENDNRYEPVLLNDLAAGYRSILTMIGDMVMRLSQGKSTVNNLSGIVLIDEIDAHLHPKYQYELPKLLSDVFPKVQFIVTTHSPIPILGLPENNKPVILTVRRDPEQGITIERTDEIFDIRQLNPEALLTSPIFGFQTLFARDAKAGQIIPISDFKEVEELEAIKKRLQELREKGLVRS